MPCLSQSYLVYQHRDRLPIVSRHQSNYVHYSGRVATECYYGFTGGIGSCAWQCVPKDLQDSLSYLALISHSSRQANNSHDSCRRSYNSLSTPQPSFTPMQHAQMNLHGVLVCMGSIRLSMMGSLCFAAVTWCSLGLGQASAATASGHHRHHLQQPIRGCHRQAPLLEVHTGADVPDKGDVAYPAGRVGVS